MDKPKSFLLSDDIVIVIFPGMHVDLVTNENAAEIVHFFIGDRSLLTELRPPFRQRLQSIRLVDIKHQKSDICSTKESRGEARKPLLPCSILTNKRIIIDILHIVRRRGYEPIFEE